MWRFSRLLRCNAASDVVLCQKKSGYAILTLNRPKSLNALSTPLVNALADHLRILDKDDSVNAIIITGAGRSFVAGADIKEMSTKNFSDVYTENLFGSLEYVREVRKPIIAAINGFALGGGCELAMSCDILIASDKAVFGQPEITLGTIPGLGGTQRLTKLIGKARAMEWVLLGDKYTAEQAEKAGLVSRVVKHDDLLPEAEKMAVKIAGFSRVASALAKDCVNKSMETTLTEGLAYEKRTFHGTFATADQKEGMGAFKDKRKADFKHC